MREITFLFGAGASIEALPIVAQISNRIELFVEILKKSDIYIENKSTANKKYFNELQNLTKYSKQQLLQQLIEDLEWLKNESKKHATVDTFAKKLTITQKKSELKKLKIALSIFFIYEQVKNPTDKRYDTFFASILNYGIHRLPENINIISWNYDSQFELAFSEYSQVSDVKSNQISLGVRQKHISHEYDSGFGIYKLNGTTSLYSTEERYRSQAYKMIFENFIGEEEVNNHSIEKLLLSYTEAKYSKSHKLNFSFAWETDQTVSSFGKDMMSDLLTNTKQTTTLVIIGYSFPFFNRQIDRKIINNMTNLNKIYFQDPNAENIVDRFKAIKEIDNNSISVVRIKDVEQFFLPNEL